jgi:hypothetical protein
MFVPKAVSGGGTIMKQWPAILVAALVLNYPGAAAASTKSEPTLWQGVPRRSCRMAVH